MSIQSATASPGRSRVGPALYVFSLLGKPKQFLPTDHRYCTVYMYCKIIVIFVVKWYPVLQLYRKIVCLLTNLLYACTHLIEIDIYFQH
jgi:hypothetical protein